MCLDLVTMSQKADCLDGRKVVVCNLRYLAKYWNRKQFDWLTAAATATATLQVTAKNDHLFSGKWVEQQFQLACTLDNANNNNNKEARLGFWTRMTKRRPEMGSFWNHCNTRERVSFLFAMPKRFSLEKFVRLDWISQEQNNVEICCFKIQLIYLFSLLVSILGKYLSHLWENSTRVTNEKRDISLGPNQSNCQPTGQ